MAKQGNFDKFIKKKTPKSEKPDRPVRRKRKSETDSRPASRPEEPVRLNRFIASAGVSSRRNADEIIQAGRVKVNGIVVKELGVKVIPGKDLVVVDGKNISPNLFVYFLMNKPKDHITTLSDEAGRQTVMSIISKYTKVRVFPVGRLDRNTTGLLLFTNDGRLAEKLSHPSNRVSKVYEIRLDRPISAEHFEKLQTGVELEDGAAIADRVEILSPAGDEIMLEIHSGKNRIVRRIFESLGYSVKKLDRVSLGPLTKKRLPRGTCRPLTSGEIGWLNMI